MIVSDRQINIDGRLIRVARIEGEKYFFLDDPESMLENLHKCGSRIDLFTFLQRVSEPTPRYRYPMEWDNMAALPVSTFDHWWKKQIDGKTRNMVRRGEKKGLVVREVPFDDVLVKGIWEVYNETPIRQGRRFLHYGKDPETVRRISVTFLETSVFIGAFLGDQLIGFVKLTSDESRSQAGIMHIVSMVQHRDKAPTNALLAHAVRSCAERKIPHLVYSNFAYGKKERDTLSDFKENNGFRRVELPRYYVPLSPWGNVALRLGLHHRWQDRVPEVLLAKLREFRNIWYKRSLASLPDAS